MRTARPYVMIEQAPRPPILSRIAGVVDLAIREMPVCGAKIERTVSGNAMIGSDHPMHRDLLVVHGYPSAANKIKVANRIGDVAISIVCPTTDSAADEALRCGQGDGTLPRAIEVLELVSAMLHASADANLAYRPRTMRRDARLDSVRERLTAIGTLVLATAEGRRTTLVEAPTPWSSLCDRVAGPIEHGEALWSRMRPMLSLSVLGVDSTRNAWSIEMKPVGVEVAADDDPMTTLRILSSLPKAARRVL